MKKITTGIVLLGILALTACSPTKTAEKKDVNINLPGVSINATEGKADIKLPGITVNTADGKTNVNMPGISMVATENGPAGEQVNVQINSNDENGKSQSFTITSDGNNINVQAANPRAGEKDSQ